MDCITASYRVERWNGWTWESLVILSSWEEAYQFASRYSAATGAWVPDADGATSIPDWGWHAPPLSIVRCG